MELINILFILVSAIFVLFAPGFFISLILFDFGKIDLIERIALSFALSIAVVSLLTFYLNLLGVKINVILVIFEVIAICFLSGLIYFLKNKNAKKRI